MPLPDRSPKFGSRPAPCPRRGNRIFAFRLAQLTLCALDPAQRCPTVRRNDAVPRTRFDKISVISEFMENFYGGAPACRRRCTRIEPFVSTIGRPCAPRGPARGRMEPGAERSTAGKNGVTLPLAMASPSRWRNRKSSARFGAFGTERKRKEALMVTRRQGTERAKGRDGGGPAKESKDKLSQSIAKAPAESAMRSG